MNPDTFAARLAGIGGVVAVCLGGSRARGEGRPDSDWDFGPYYLGGIDTAAIRAFGFAGEIVEPGAWARALLGLGRPDGLKLDAPVRAGEGTA